MIASHFWLVTILAAGIFCLARGVMDLRQRRYAWGIGGLALGCALLLMPIQTQAAKLDLPPPPRR